jgi:hypothetical protein
MSDSESDHSFLNDNEIERIFDIADTLFSSCPTHHFFKPDERVAEALRNKAAGGVPLTANETSLLMFEDGSSYMLGITTACKHPSVLWRGIRKLVKARAVAIFWQRVTVERTHAPGGVAWERDRTLRESDLLALQCGDVKLSA